MALLYPDVILVLLVGVAALAAGAPALGYTVGGAAWIAQRVAAVKVERRLLDITDVRRRLGFGVASSMLRVWLLACSIIAVGVAGEREDGLAAALVIFGAFSVYFIRTTFAHIKQRRSRTS